MSRTHQFMHYACFGPIVSYRIMAKNACNMSTDEAVFTEDFAPATELTAPTVVPTTTLADVADLKTATPIKKVLTVAERAVQADTGINSKRCTLKMCHLFVK